MKNLDLNKLNLQSMLAFIMASLGVSKRLSMGNKGFHTADEVGSKLSGVLLSVVFAAIAVVIVIAVFGGTIFQAGSNSIGNFTSSINTQGTAVGGFSATLAPILGGVVFLLAVVVVIILIVKHAK